MYSGLVCTTVGLVGMITRVKLRSYWDTVLANQILFKVPRDCSMFVWSSAHVSIKQQAW